ncbi:hypothetical protein CTA1_9956 [Colletotrichum tanaceti]|uniref:Uncharacterized protein n=1 Tax=Colletotrichum tanaceti TaxID=1306861 RepID=A0A4U6XVN5_9PEZI|nr:hypothetical protein CTA1_9956 [Colletotrichum tanaceti]
MEQPRSKQFVMFSVEGEPDSPKCMTITFWPILEQVPMRVAARVQEVGWCLRWLTGGITGSGRCPPSFAPPTPTMSRLE